MVNLKEVTTYEHERVAGNLTPKEVARGLAFIAMPFINPAIVPDFK